jgi:hypothetical protein
MHIKLVPIYEPVAFNLADIQQAMREGEDLYQRRLAQTREMLAEREKDIPGFTRYAPDERALLFGDNPPPTVRLGGCGVEVSTIYRMK